jgi:hypothetical protein
MPLPILNLRFPIGTKLQRWFSFGNRQLAIDNHLAFSLLPSRAPA